MKTRPPWPSIVFLARSFYAGNYFTQKPGIPSEYRISTHESAAELASEGRGGSKFVVQLPRPQILAEMVQFQDVSRECFYNGFGIGGNYVAPEVVAT